MDAAGGVTDAVAAAGVDLVFGILLGLDEFLRQLHGVGKVYVVVAGGMGDEQLTVKPGGIIDGRRVAVAVGILLGRAHVALRVDGVVLAPIGDRGPGKAGL